MPGRNQHARLRVGGGGATRARPPAGRRAQGRWKGGPRGCGSKLASVLARRGSGDRGRAALPEDARGARAEAAPAARLRPPRPRRDGELRRLPADARGDRSLAAHRPRALAQLAVHAGRRDGLALVSSRTAGRAAAGRAAAVFRLARGMGGLHQSDREGLHAQLVGCAASSTARHARGADRRPADERRALRGAGCAGPGALRGAADGAAHGRVRGGAGRCCARLGAN